MHYYVSLGKMLREEGEPGRAREILRSGLRIDSLSSESYFELGAAAEQHGEDGEKYFQRAAALGDARAIGRVKENSGNRKQGRPTEFLNLIAIHFGILYILHTHENKNLRRRRRQHRLGEILAHAHAQRALRMEVLL